MARCNVINLTLVVSINIWYVWRSLIISSGKPGSTLQHLIWFRKGNLVKKNQLLIHSLKDMHAYFRLIYDFPYK